MIIHVASHVLLRFRYGRSRCLALEETAVRECRVRRNSESVGSCDKLPPIPEHRGRSVISFLKKKLQTKNLVRVAHRLDLRHCYLLRFSPSTENAPLLCSGRTFRVLANKRVHLDAEVNQEPDN